MNLTSPRASSPPAESRKTLAALVAGAIDSLKGWLGAWPVGLNNDILYLWATFRLRHRPVKMLAMLTLLGVLCYVWSWMGREYALAPIQKGLIALRQGLMDWKHPKLVSTVFTTLRRTSEAVFSSLNILSCISIVIMSVTMQRLLKQGHMEALMLAPRQVRPSALFYAIASRYLPLAFVAILVIYLDPKRNPFDRYPFTLRPGQEASPEMTPLVWAGLRELSIFIFCPVNLFMDLALTYWIFSRWRMTAMTTILAMVVIGLVTPVMLMAVHVQVEQYVRSHIYRSSGIFEYLPQPFFAARDPFSVSNISATIHYLLTSALSALTAMLVLGNLDARWRRIRRSPTKDPVLIKPLD